MSKVFCNNCTHQAKDYLGESQFDECRCPSNELSYVTGSKKLKYTNHSGFPELCSKVNTDGTCPDFSQKSRGKRRDNDHINNKELSSTELLIGIVAISIVVLLIFAAILSLV